MCEHYRCRDSMTGLCPTQWEQKKTSGSFYPARLS
jgi:hypothetical protein